MGKARRVTGIFLAICLVASNLTLIPASAAERSNVEAESSLEGAGDVLYTPNLDSLDEFDTFAGNNPGTWSAKDGTIRIDGGTGNKAIAKDQEFTNFVYEVDVTVEKQADMGDTSSSQGGILFRASKPENNVSDGYYGYFFCVDAKNQKVTLGRSSGNNWYEIASKKMTVKFGETYHVMVAAYGSHITCYVDYNGDNYAKLDVTDSTHASGSIGMRNWLSHASYKNAVVREYTETELSEEESYTNPLLNMCADPDVLYHDGTYYLYPTNAGDANDDQGIKVYTSTDLVHWADKGWALKNGDGWGTRNFWAPDVIERDGTFYMYYVSEEQICVATSDSPLGPYKQDVKKPMHSDVREIDAHVFYDEASQQYYIYFVRFTAGNAIWGAKLNDDMMSIDESSLTEIMHADQGWDQDMGMVNEGPFMLTKDGKYYLTYSGSHFQSPQYGSGYAVADSPLGPFTKYENNPIMQSNTLAHGTGHHCITTSPDGKEMFMVYHSHHDLENTEPRQLCIDRVQFTTDREGETVLEVKGPTVTPQALPSGARDVNNFIEFNEESLKGIEIENGTAVKDWNLPTQVEIYTSKGDGDTTYTADMTWDLEDISYDPQEKGEQTVLVKGTAALPEGIENLGNLPLEISTQVTVKASTDPDQRLKDALKKVEIKNAKDVRENITLPTEMDGVHLTWESDNQKVISTEVKKNKDYYDTPAGVVSRQDKDTKVKLTVTGECEGQTASKDIEVTVKAKPKKQDENAGYLYVHFKEYPGVRGEQDVFFGISKDGLNWTALNNNEAILKSTVGDHATRDPYIIRSAEGDKFYLIATDQDIYKYGEVLWDRLSTEGSRALTIWESTDLVHWTNQRNVPVADSIQAGCAWAPEAIYDEATGEYLVYWSSKVESDGYARQYNWVSKTRDFYTFTEPELFNDLPISNIDTSVYKEGNSYYKLLKLEDGGNTHVILQSAKEHPLAYGEDVNQVQIGDKTYNNVGGNYQQIDNSADGCLESFRGSYEGATMFKFNDRDEWCVMVDEYGGQTRGYIPFTTTDLDKENSIKALADSEYMMQDGGKHGAIIPITQEEYDSLVEAYGVPEGPLASMEEQKKPVVTYDFENVEGREKSVANASGKKKAADLQLQLSGNSKVQYDEEKGSNVLYLDGTEGTYGELPQGMFDGADQLTISMDVKSETTEFNHVDFNIGQDQNKYLFLRFRSDEITSGVSVRSFQNEKNISYKPEGGCLNQWRNVVIVLDDHDMTLYVDHKIVGTQKVRNMTELGENLKSYLGKSFYPDPYFKGSFDNIQIYNRALSEKEIGGTYDLCEKLEAEDAQLTGKAKVVERGDASGGKKVGTIDDTESTVTFSLNAPADGTYTVEVAAGGDKAFPNPSHKYWTNGDKANAKVVKYEPKGWDIWNLYPVEVELKKGMNTLTFSHSGEANSFAELDYIVYYRAYPQMSVSVGGEKLEGFAMNTSDYSVDVENLADIPKVEAVMEGADKNVFEVEVKQGSKERPEAYIKLTSKDDPDYVKNYTIRFYGPKTFQNPLVNYGADPYVTYQDGYYYYVRVNHDKSLWVSKSPELSRIGQVEPKMVYAPTGNEPNQEMWAPEIHYLDGKWYIYYTAGAGANHRMCVVESKTSDAQGEYVFKGQMAPATDKWAIDQTVLELDGQLYAIWSGWDGDVNVDQRIYIARMDNPWTISGERVELSKPEYTWEVQGGTPTINEGPQIAKAPDGTVNIVYSASGSWSPYYCLGCLTLKKGEDPMEKNSWIKVQEPIFQKNNSTTYSTGHGCFTTSPDGTEDYMVYHATRNSGEGWNGRGVRTQRVYWNEDGTPFLGSAIEYNGKVNWPSGTPEIEYIRYEAEDAQLSGNVKVEDTYNSSNGKKVTGFAKDGDMVTFSVNAEKAGTYKLYIGAAAGADGAGVSVQVNEEEPVDKAVANFNASPAANICPDNWAGYEVEVSLNQGENTITVGKSAVYGAADIDYVELQLLKETEEPTVDKSELQSMVDEAKKLSKEDYTADSWKQFRQALKNAEEVLGDPNADQITVDTAKDTLEKAMNELVKNDTDSGDGGSDGNGDGNPGQPGTSKPDQGNQSSNGNNGNKAVNTGDNSDVIPLACSMVVAIGILAFVLINRKKKHI